MGMSLGDAFNRRKKLDADIKNWTARLAQAGQDSREYFTKQIEGSNAFLPDPATEKISTRHYTIEECQQKLKQLIAEDQGLALRISLTNQKAKATVEDLNGVVREMTVPELLVLKAEIIPKIEQAARAVPVRSDSINIFDQGENYIKQRSIKKLEKKKETLTDKGLKIEEITVIGYQVTEITEYGIPQRQAWNEIDKIQEFAQRVKQAINEANKMELVEI